MNTENELLQRLMISKKIMEKHNQMERGKTNLQTINNPVLQEFEPVNAKYNLPNDFLEEESSNSKIKYFDTVPTTDRILNSKLPDEIKQLMIEHPIQQPKLGTSPTLSNDLIDKASRLMNTDASGKQINNSQKVKNFVNESNEIKNDSLKKLLKEVVKDVLHENGLLVESENDTNDIFKFRVGSHIFEGKLTKIKKIAK